MVVLTGAPGAGKGTQGDFIVERLGFRKVSTGDALRRQIREGTELGKAVEKVMASGQLVSDDLLYKIVTSEVGTNSKERILLDGYPRNLDQARCLEGAVDIPHKVAVAIHLDVSRGDLLGRLSGRRVCESCGKGYHMETDPPQASGKCTVCNGKVIQRPDDMAEKVAVRLDVYDSHTLPILDFYKQRGLYVCIDGTGSTEDVYARLEYQLKQLA